MKHPTKEKKTAFDFRGGATTCISPSQQTHQMRREAIRGFGQAVCFPFFLEIHPMGIDLNTSDLHQKHKFLCGHVEIGHSKKKGHFKIWFSMHDD